MLPKYHVTSTSCQLAALVVVRGARDSGDLAAVRSRCSTADRGDTGRPRAGSHRPVPDPTHPHWGCDSSDRRTRIGHRRSSLTQADTVVGVPGLCGGDLGGGSRRSPHPANRRWPMISELTDLELWERLESVNLSNEAFKHREHVRAAFVALSTRADQKYNETMTWAYLVLIHERMHREEFEDSRQFLTAYPELLNHRGILGRYYDVETLTRSPLARRLFLLPGSEQLASAAQGSSR